jgi:hypothetical protein
MQGNINYCFALPLPLLNSYFLWLSTKHIPQTYHHYPLSHNMDDNQEILRPETRFFVFHTHVTVLERAAQSSYSHTRTYIPQWATTMSSPSQP